MIRVFHIITRLDLGGAESVAANIAKSRNSDFEYHVLEVMRGKSCFSKQFIDNLMLSGVKCHRSLFPFIQFHFLFERIAALLFPLRFIWIYLRWRPNIIHAHTELPDLCITVFFKIFPCLVKKCRILRTIHNNILWTGQNYLGNIVESFYKCNKSNIAISSSVNQSYQLRYDASAPVIYNGVKISPQKDYPHLVPKKINVLFAGRFESYKGIKILVDVISSLSDDDRFHFHIIGDGSMRNFIEDKLSGFNNISISKPIYGISSYLASFDCMFMPSEFEGLSIMAIEAAMAGLPNIINDVPGLNEIYPNNWPLKVTNNDIGKYLSIFKEVIPTFDRNDLSEQTKQYAKNRFDISIMQRNYESFYRDSLL